MMDVEPELDVETSVNARKRPYAAIVESKSETTASAADTISSPQTENGKRRRRKLSCKTCQRLKCRCDYDPVSRTCHRCKTLRRPCSITDDDFHIVPGPDAATADPAVEVKKRLEAVEGSITEVKLMIRELQTSLSLCSRDGGLVALRHNNSRPAPQSPDLAPENAEPEDISDPADAGIGSAPALVMRAMTTHLAGDRRRVLEHFNSDLVRLGLLDEASADSLIRLFSRHRDSRLVVRDISHSEPSKELRKASPFLHAVCCLHGMPYGNESWPPANVRRQVYQQVRMMLGQALLASPLPLDEINAILLMSVYSNQSPVIDDSPVDYIDSWLLTGYCAQQAMLSISFSTIVENVKQGKPTDEDRRAIRLWASVCLHHLHWAVTTGRPSTIPAQYLNQCNMLLSLFEATIHEGMVVAEILLYTALNRKLTHHSYLDASGECKEFAAWKQKWCHLFALPRSSAFKLSYHSAYLILAVRSLEDFSSGRATEDLLSPQPIQHPSSASSSSATTNPPPPPSRNHQQQAQARTTALRFAVQILETFLEMSTPLRNEIPIYLHMCISYSALVIAQYWRWSGAEEVAEAATTTTTRVSAETVSELLAALEEWCAGCPSQALVTAYSAGLARRRVLMLLADHTGGNDEGETTGQTQGQAQGEGQSQGLGRGKRDYAARLGLDGALARAEREERVGSPLYSAAEGLLGLGGGGVVEAERLASVGHGANGHMHLDVGDFGLDITPEFPSMEDFFGGGFLDFMR